MKIGGDEQAGKQYICRYFSYKNDDDVGTQITVIQDAVDTEPLVVVDHYQTNAGEDNFRRSERFVIGEFDAVAALYERRLLEVGAPLKDS